MKRQSIFLPLCMCAALAAFTCNKENPDDFCNRERVTADTLMNRTGTVFYSDPYKRWAINIDSASNSMDNIYTGFPCSLSNELQKEGTKIKVNAILKKLNEDEIVLPKIKTQELFYLDITSISKQN